MTETAATGGPGPAGGTPLPPGMGRVAPRELAARGVTTLEQAAAMSDRELLAIHGVGPKAVRVLRAAVSSPAPPSASPS